MLHWVLEHLEQRVPEFPTRASGRRNSPWVAISGLTPHFPLANARHFRNRLDELKDLRQRADYDVDDGSWPQAMVELGERRAVALAETLATLLQLEPGQVGELVSLVGEPADRPAP